MLVELSISDFALVDRLRIGFAPGFSVLTGETGAGKSIVVDALGFAVGDRVGSEVVRTGADKCIVEALFEVENDSPAVKYADECGIEIEDTQLVIAREFSSAGRSICRANGKTVTLTVMKQLTKSLIDIHGQHEHQSLLDVPFHVDIYDNWCGDSALTLRASVTELYAKLIVATKESRELAEAARDRERVIDIMRFQASEIDSAELSPGEDDELDALRRRLASSEKLKIGADECLDLLNTDGGVLDCLSRAQTALGKMAEADNSLAGTLETVGGMVYAAQDTAVFLRDYLESIDSGPASLEEVENRLFLINALKRKYGNTIEEIKLQADIARDKLDQIEHAEENAREIDLMVQKITSELSKVSLLLSECRLARREEFEKRIESELKVLAMGVAKFAVDIHPGPLSNRGTDELEFMISANFGEPVKPLARIASGGEMSRVMLALKTVTAGSQVPTMVFDEIDTGIGGLVAQVLGNKLAALGECKQVLCVTHLPQIASKASSHFSIIKEIVNERSVIRTVPLRGEERVIELARMLGADQDSGAALLHAREMLTLANHWNG